VFHVFDLDDSGFVGVEELLLLGEERRRMGHASGRWGKAQAENMMDAMDTGGDGVVDKNEFARSVASACRRLSQLRRFVSFLCLSK